MRFHSFANFYRYRTKSDFKLNLDYYKSYVHSTFTTKGDSVFREFSLYFNSFRVTAH